MVLLLTAVGTDADKKMIFFKRLLHVDCTNIICMSAVNLLYDSLSNAKNIFCFVQYKLKWVLQHVAVLDITQMKKIETITFYYSALIMYAEFKVIYSLNTL